MALVGFVGLGRYPAWGFPAGADATRAGLYEYAEIIRAW